VRAKVDHVNKLTGRYYVGDNLVSYGGRQAGFDIRGVHPDHLFLEKTVIISGRYINEFDLAERRKVCVLGAQVVARLFEEEAVQSQCLSGYRCVYRYRLTRGRGGNLSAGNYGSTALR